MRIHSALATLPMLNAANPYALFFSARRATSPPAANPDDSAYLTFLQDLYDTLSRLNATPLAMDAIQGEERQRRLNNPQGFQRWLGFKQGQDAYLSELTHVAAAIELSNQHPEWTSNLPYQNKIQPLREAFRVYLQAVPADLRQLWYDAITQKHPLLYPTTPENPLGLSKKTRDMIADHLRPE